jgi:hypothetical protein
MSLPTITEPGTLDINISITDAGSLVARSSLFNAFRAISPSGAITPLALISTTPATGDAATITGVWRLDLTAADNTFNGVWTIAEGGAIADTLGNTNGGIQQTLDTVSVNIVSSTLPYVQPKSFDPVQVPINDYEFAIRYVDDVAIDTSTVGRFDILVEGPNGFSKTPMTELSRVPATGNAAEIVVQYRVDGPFNEAANGTYLIKTVAGSFADTSGNVNLEGSIGTFSVAIGGATGATGTVTDFRNRTTGLPAGWTAGAGILSFTSSGMTIPAAGSWFTNYVYGPALPVMGGGTDPEVDWQIDYIGSASGTAVGLSTDFGLFNADSCLVWFPDGTLWTGAAGVFSTTTHSPNVPLRLRFRSFAGEMIVTFYRNLGSGFAQAAQTTVPIPTNLLNNAKFYLDANGDSLTLLQTVVGTGA